MIVSGWRMKEKDCSLSVTATLALNAKKNHKNSIVNLFFLLYSYLPSIPSTRRAMFCFAYGLNQASIKYADTKSP